MNLEEILKEDMKHELELKAITERDFSFIDILSNNATNPENNMEV